MTPTQLALGFTASQWCVGATIIGATSVQQLRENLDAMRLRLSPELRAEIDAIHQRWPNPAP